MKENIIKCLINNKYLELEDNKGVYFAMYNKSLKLYVDTNYKSDYPEDYECCLLKINYKGKDFPTTREISYYQIRNIGNNINGSGSDGILALALYDLFRDHWIGSGILDNIDSILFDENN